MHHRMKKSGISAQKSVFFVNGDENQVNLLMDDIAAVMKADEDDLRAYPITRPGEVWTNGPNPLADFPLIDLESGKMKKKVGQKKKSKKGKSKKISDSRWRRLLGLK